MIKYDWHQEHRVLEVRPVGELKVEDFTALSAQVDPVIQTYGRLGGLLINAADFAGWESFVALVTHCQFIRGHHRHIHRIAVVSDHTLMGFMPRLVDHFVSAEVRPFATSERRQALDWLAEAG